MQQFIEEFITRQVLAADGAMYSTPIVGYAGPEDTIFQVICDQVGTAS
ncbi:MAG TPA: hypothetical protein VHS59_09190 [Bacillota bacterium]|nr:hypothetical protein [Bacillota bacterium]